MYCFPGQQTIIGFSHSNSIFMDTTDKDTAATGSGEGGYIIFLLP